MAWIHVPQGFCPSAPEPGDSISDSVWRAQLLAQSVTSNETLSPSSTWLRRLKRTTWTMRLFGTIYEPSTASRGVAAWIASLAESPASRTASQERSSAQPTTATCGKIPHASSGKSDPDLSFSKTWHKAWGTSMSALGESYETWATRLRRAYSRRLKLAHHMSDCDSLPWATPTANTSTSHRGRWNKTKLQTVLHHQAENWMTPVATQQGLYTYEHGDHDKPTPTLAGQARLWRTPNARDYKDRSIDQKDRPDAQLSLGRQVLNWATPMAADGDRTSEKYKRGNLTLLGQARQFPTPTARDGHSWDGPNKKNPRQPFEAYSHLLQMSSESGHTCSPRCRILNPHFAEWLQGFPFQWTEQHAFSLSEIALSHWWRQSRSALSYILSDRRIE